MAVDYEAELEALRQHILDIDAHATPYGDIPDEPGWIGTYLVTAGALHRALGKVGHTAPKCQAEAELAKLREAARRVVQLVDHGADTLAVGGAIAELRHALDGGDR